MPNQITATGLQLKTLDEVVTDLTADFSTIYGPDTDFTSSSPDGNMIENLSQEIVDTLDLDAQIYSGMDPDQAIGTTLDARVGINGIKRLPGTYSTTDITIVTSQAVALVGLDGNDAPVGNEFIVADAAGNQWVLLNSFTIGSATTTILLFRAVLQGAVLTVATQLTIPVTIVLGVTSVNNPSSQLSVGTNSETDAALKIRRRKSVAISSVGFYESLIAALSNVTNVTAVAVYENDTDATVDGTPSHSIWVVVGGSGAAADIAKAIYAKRSAGCGMRGAQSYNVVRIDGSTFTVFWDQVEAEVLYFRFTADVITGDVTTTGNTHSSTSITNIADVSKFIAGGLIRGTGIPAGATIVTIDDATPGAGIITISAAATATASGVTLTVVPVVISALKTAIVAAFSADVNETLNINAMSSIVQGFNPNLLLTSVGLSSDGVTYTNTLVPSAKNKQFTLATGQVTVL